MDEDKISAVLLQWFFEDRTWEGLQDFERGRVSGAAAEIAKSERQLWFWLEEQAKLSPTGISFDWVPSIEGSPSGWRFMRRHFISEPHESLRQSVLSGGFK